MIVARIGLLAVAVSLAPACRDRSRTSGVPDKRPTDFSIDYSRTSRMAGGGSYRFTCSERCMEAYGVDYPGGPPPTYYDVSPAQLDALYEALRIHHFWQLASVPRDASTGGSDDERLTVNANGQVHTVVNTPNEAVRSEQRADYTAIKSALLALRPEPDGSNLPEDASIPEKAAPHGKVALGAIKTSASLPDVDRVLAGQVVPAVRRCLNKALDNDPSVAGGSVVIRLRVQDDGEVSSADIVDRHVLGDSLSACVVSVFRRVQFTAPGHKVDVQIPLTLSRGE